MLRKLLDRKWVGGTCWASGRAAGVNFQACSFNHSDISPLTINHLRAVRNSVAQNPPSRISDSICPLVPVVWRPARRDDSANCVRPSNVVRSSRRAALTSTAKWMVARVLDDDADLLRRGI